MSSIGDQQGHFWITIKKQGGQAVMVNRPIVSVYHGNQSAHCEDDVKQFIRCAGCYRVASLKPFVSDVVPLEPLHDCCSNCSLLCKCGGSCNSIKLPFEQVCTPDEEVSPLRMRDISEQQKDIKDAITELKDKFKSRCPLEVHGFSEELVEQLVQNCNTIFTISDILTFPVFSVRTAVQILDVFINDKLCYSANVSSFTN